MFAPKFEIEFYYTTPKSFSLLTADDVKWNTESFPFNTVKYNKPDLQTRKLKEHCKSFILVSLARTDEESDQ